MTPLAIAALCLRGCGMLDSGTTADPPHNPRRGTRWAELDATAETHTRVTGHPTSVHVKGP